MPSLISISEFTKLEKVIRKILEKSKIKNEIYKILIVPNQNISLKKLERLINKTPQLKHIPDKKDGKKIIFHSLDARYMPHTFIEGGISKSLQLRGHKPKMVICGGMLSMCTTFHRIDHPPNEWSCKNCINFSKKFYETAGLDYSIYSNYAKPDQYNKTLNNIDDLSIEECKKYVYKKVNVGKHAEVSANRYFKGYVSSRQLYDDILRKELLNAIISTDISEKIVEKEKPDVLVTCHACYSSWGSFADIFKNKKIRICVWASGEGNTITFDIHKSDEYFDKYYDDVRKKKGLTKKETQELENFIKRRTKGREGQVVLYGFSDVKEEKLSKKFGLEKYKKIYAMFPNVPWDAALMNADVVFDNVYDWVSASIEIFKRHPESLLLIKIHPSETKVMESKKTVEDYIKEKFRDLPKNIQIISPNTNISPYSIFQLIDYGVVYNGTIGLEMALRNIPVIVAGKAHYGNKGFTHDIKSKEKYENSLFRLDNKTEDKKKKVEIYAYFHFIKKFVPKSFIYCKNFLDLGWNVKSLKDFYPGNDKFLDHICDYILDGGLFENW